MGKDASRGHGRPQTDSSTDGVTWGTPEGVTWGTPRGVTWALPNGVTWGAPGLRGLGRVAALFALGVVAPGAAIAATPVVAPGMTSVIVRESPNMLSAAEHSVVALGGHVGRQLPIVNGFAATVPTTAVAALETSDGVASVTEDKRLTAAGRSWGGRVRGGWDELSDGGNYDGTDYNPAKVATSMYNSDKLAGAPAYWASGLTGKGVGVALIDTGVTPVKGLDDPGKIINGPDLSFDSQDPARTYLDGFGHGTHLAGIIAGNDMPGRGSYRYLKKLNSNKFLGMAPDAHIVNVKVGDSHGVTDVSQVIAAIDWVVAHKDDPGLNIKAIELAYGVDSTQDYRIDPLTYAVEQAWQKGVTVVVAAGNGGKDASGQGAGLLSPAKDPFVIAVGAQDPNGTIDATDDSVAAFSSSGRGDGRPPDVVAPGMSIPSLRAPGSTLDEEHANARLGARFLKGGGTSQASAVVAGAVALIAQQRPDASPDAIKSLILENSDEMSAESDLTAGRGRMNLANVLRSGVSADATQQWEKSTGTGSLDEARGTYRATIDGVPISGEVDIFGKAFDSAAMAKAMADGTAWIGGVWNGSSWTGSSWSGSSWSGSSWTGSSWSGSSWSGSSWSGSSWSGSSWS